MHEKVYYKVVLAASVIACDSNHVARTSCNILNTRKIVLSGFSNTEKLVEKTQVQPVF